MITDGHPVCPKCGSYLEDDISIIISDSDSSVGKTLNRYACLTCSENDSHDIWYDGDTGKKISIKTVEKILASGNFKFSLDSSSRTC